MVMVPWPIIWFKTNTHWYQIWYPGHYRSRAHWASLEDSFYLFSAKSPTKRPVHRRQTNNILLSHVRFLWLFLACCKHVILKKKSKLRKIFLDIYVFRIFFFNPPKNMWLTKVHRALHMSLYLSETVFRSKIWYNLPSQNHSWNCM